MWPKWLLFIFVHMIIDFIYPLWLHFVQQHWCRLFSKACHMCIISKLLCAASLTMTKWVAVCSNLPSQPSSCTTHFPLWSRFNRYLIYFELRLTVLQKKTQFTSHDIDFSGDLLWLNVTFNDSILKSNCAQHKDWIVGQVGAWGK